MAFEQQLAPGSGGSGADVPFTRIFGTSVNASGEVAFVATTSTNADGGDIGLFSNVGGNVRAVVFEGGQIEVTPGEFRTVADLSYFYGFNPNVVDRSSSGFSDRGQLTFCGSISPMRAKVFSLRQFRTIQLAAVVDLLVSRGIPTPHA